MTRSKERKGIREACGLILHFWEIPFHREVAPKLPRRIPQRPISQHQGQTQKESKVCRKTQREYGQAKLKRNRLF